MRKLALCAIIFCLVGKNYLNQNRVSYYFSESMDISAVLAQFIYRKIASLELEVNVISI